MIHSIENAYLKVQVNSMGAQLWSVQSKKSNTEYLWQGSPEHWTGRAYNLFPFIGRMYEGIFRYDGKEYPSRAHGLARYFDFTLETQTENALTFLLKDSEETKKEYPFSFEYRVRFILKDATLTTEYSVKNTDERELICTFGGHPGINVPFGAGSFEEYYLDFATPTDVRRQLLAEGDKFLADKSVPYPLKDGTKLYLKHELFEHDAIILENTSKYVALKCDKESRYVSLRYDDYKFIGFWQPAKNEPPFLCLEPWDALPAIDGAVCELENKPHMTRVPTKETKSISFTLEIHE
ncbi:MAG: aldose 1-epimerase family protein [Clostridia bacterium]|nr:aldose 1-epimerase family protein [Clostridia bacterium]